MWVDDNRDGLAWGEVVDVVESGVRRAEEEGSGRLRLGKLDSQVTRKGNDRATQVTRVRYGTGTWM